MENKKHHLSAVSERPQSTASISCLSGGALHPLMSQGFKGR